LICVKVQSTYFGLHNFATWTAHSAFWTAQNWLDCTVRICPVNYVTESSHPNLSTLTTELWNGDNFKIIFCRKLQLQLLIFGVQIQNENLQLSGLL